MVTMPLVVAAAVVHNLHTHTHTWPESVLLKVLLAKVLELAHTAAMLDALHMQNTMKFFEARRVR